MSSSARISYNTFEQTLRAAYDTVFNNSVDGIRFVLPDLSEFGLCYRHTDENVLLRISELYDATIYDGETRVKQCVFDLYMLSELCRELDVSFICIANETLKSSIESQSYADRLDIVYE